MKAVKKWGAAGMILAVFFFVCCSPAPPAVPDFAQSTDAAEAENAGSGAQIALIATEEHLASEAGQGLWGVLSRFAGENGLSAVSYSTVEDDANAAASTLELAAKSGARLVVCQEEPVTAGIVESTFRYPDIDFILQGVPEAGAPPANVAALRHAPEEAGWLTGYAAGAMRLEVYGYVAQADEASQRFLLGCLLGADAALSDAAQNAPAAASGADAGETAHAAQMAGATLPAEAAEEDWEREVARVLAQLPAGRQGALVFMAGSEAQARVLQALPSGGALAAGVQVRPWPSAPVASSAEYGAETLVQQALQGWLAGRFPGGQALRGGIEDGSIALCLNTQSGADGMKEAVERGKERFVQTGAAALLAGRVVPGADGAWPVPEELGLEWLAPLPPVPPADGSLSASLPVSAESGEAPSGQAG